MEGYEVLIYLFDTDDYAALNYEMSEELAEQLEDYCQDSEIWEQAWENDDIDHLLVAAANQAAKYVHEYYIAADDKLKAEVGITDEAIENMWEVFGVDDEEKEAFYEEPAEEQISDLVRYLYEGQAFTISI